MRIRAARAGLRDPGKLGVGTDDREDPGHLEGNVAFIYLDAFDTDRAGLAEMKAHYVRGGLGDSVVKKRLENVLQELLAPIRARRDEFAKDRGHVLQLFWRVLFHWPVFKLCFAQTMCKTFRQYIGQTIFQFGGRVFCLLRL